MVLRRLHWVLGLCLLYTVSAYAEPPLTLKVVPAGEASLKANFTLVLGQTDAVLVDVPFTRADAHRLVAELLDSGRNLQAVFISHDHPDHYFSLDVIADAFPQAAIYAAPAVVDDIWKSWPLKLKRWGPLLAGNGPRHPVAPQALNQPYFELEGQRIEVLGPMQGDHKHATALYIPAIQALIAGDLVFDGIFPWTAEALAPGRAAWVAALDRLIGLQPVTVVPGHGLGDLGPQSLHQTRDYLVEFEKLRAKSKDSADLIRRVRARFPEMRDVVDDFILTNSAKVAMGEMPAWDE